MVEKNKEEEKCIFAVEAWGMRRRVLNFIMPPSGTIPGQLERTDSHTTASSSKITQFRGIVWQLTDRTIQVAGYMTIPHASELGWTLNLSQRESVRLRKRVFLLARAELWIVSYSRVSRKSLWTSMRTVIHVVPVSMSDVIYNLVRW